MPQNTPPIIVGINRTQDASITIFKGADHYGSIHKERITRVKHAWGQLNDLALYKKVFPVLEQPVDVIVECYSSDEEIKNDASYQREIEETLNLSKDCKRLKISHHLSHIYSAFPVSKFQEAAGLVIDFQGSYVKDIDEHYPGSPKQHGLEIASYYSCTENKITCVDKHIWSGDRAKPEGLGTFYNFLSKCFFTGDGKEGKVMGLSNYGDATALKLPDLEVIDGKVYIGQEWIDLFARAQDYDFQKNKKSFQEKANLAAIGQVKFQEALVKMSQWLREHTGHDNLCYVGGCALNVTANTLIRKHSKFKNLFIPPAPHDGGTSLGCAMYGVSQILNTRVQFGWESDYLGPVQSTTDLENKVAGYEGLTLSTPEDLSDECASLLQQGYVMAIFQGQSEFGPRALGNRSILADPRYAVTKFWINQLIKGREWYRPIAPLVAEEEASQYFDLEHPSPFMLYTAQIKDAYRGKLEAVTHIDNSARVQTVNPQNNQFIYNLLKAFQQKTGTAVLCNTSFNLKGETIVETLEEAIESFNRTSIHYLIVPPYLVSKKNKPQNPLLLTDLKIHD